jgi:hypothetical protein
MWLIAYWDYFDCKDTKKFEGMEFFRHTWVKVVVVLVPLILNT